MKNFLVMTYFCAVLLAATGNLHAQVSGNLGLVAPPGPNIQDQPNQKLAIVEITVTSNPMAWSPADEATALFPYSQWREILKGDKSPLPQVKKSDVTDFEVKAGLVAGPVEGVANYGASTPCVQQKFTVWVRATSNNSEEADALVKQTNVEKAAEIIAGNFVENLKARYAERMAESKNKESTLQKQIEETKGRLAKLLQQQVKEMGGTFTTDLNTLRKQGADLEANVQELEITLRSKLARKETLRREIEEIEHQSQARGEEERVRHELAEIIALREKELARLCELQKQGKVTESDVNKAQERLSESRIRLAEREGKPATGQLRQSAVGLAEMNADIAESQVRLEEMKKRLEDLRNRCVNVQVNSLTLEAEIEEAKRDLQILMAQRQVLSLVLRNTDALRVIVSQARSEDGLIVYESPSGRGGFPGMPLGIMGPGMPFGGGSAYTTFRGEVQPTGSPGMPCGAMPGTSPVPGGAGAPGH